MLTNIKKLVYGWIEDEHPRINGVVLNGTKEIKIWTTTDKQIHKIRYENENVYINFRLIQTKEIDDSLDGVFFTMTDIYKEGQAPQCINYYLIFEHSGGTMSEKQFGIFCKQVADYVQDTAKIQLKGERFWENV